MRGQLSDPVTEEQAAELCMALASSHAESVGALLGARPGVAKAAEALLLMGVDGDRAVSLAQALLDAGYPIESQDKLPDCVIRLLKQRASAAEKDFQRKCDKYEERSKTHDDRVGGFYKRHPDKPYLSLDAKYSRINLNGRLMFSNTQLVCRHLEKFMDADHETVKQRLANLKNEKLDGFDNATLEAAEKSSWGAGMVVFSRKNFGKLLAAVVPQLRLQAGDERSFELCHEVGKDPGKSGHSMRCFIRKKEQHAPLLTVSLYEANVTADRMHMNVLPEELHRLDFDQFDSLKVCEKLTAEILCLNLKDAGVAEPLAGRFVEPDAIHQQLAFQNALRHYSAAGMRAAAKALNEGPGTEPQAPINWKALLRASTGNNPGLNFALQKGHADVVRALGEALEKSGLSFEDKKEILLAKDGNGSPGLLMALAYGQAEAIKALGEVLEKSGLSPKDKKEILLAKGLDDHPGLYFALQNGRADAIKALGEVLEKAELSPDDKKEILLAKRADGIPGLLMALQDDRADAIKALGTILKSQTLKPQALSELLTPSSPDKLTGLRLALDGGHRATVRAYAEMVIELQDGPEPQLRGADAEHVLTYMRDASGVAAVEGSKTEYNHMLEKEPELHKLLKRAESLLERAAAAA